MGFSSKKWCTIWSVEPFSASSTKGRISCSRKNRETGEYEDDFSGYVLFVGTAAANKAMQLKEKDRIRLGDVEVKTKYVPEKNITYYNFYVYSFDTSDEVDNADKNVTHASAPEGNAVESFEEIVSGVKLPY